jgi:transcriptional regulator with XRE-family HTH domain
MYVISDNRSHGNVKNHCRKIAQIRHQKGMTQEDLAGEADINRAFLSNIENGRANFSITMLLKIASSLGSRPRPLELTAPFFSKQRG